MNILQTTDGFYFIFITGYRQLSQLKIFFWITGIDIHVVYYSLILDIFLCLVLLRIYISFKSN